MFYIIYTPNDTAPTNNTYSILYDPSKINYKLQLATINCNKYDFITYDPTEIVSQDEI